MKQSPSWEANRFAASQEIPAFYGTRRFITTLTSARHLSLSWASPIQSITPHPTYWRSILILSSHLRLGLPSGRTKVSVQVRGFVSEYFVTKIRFHSDELLARRPAPRLEDHPLSCVRGCLFNIFAATLHIGDRSSIRNPRTRHAVVTGIHLHMGTIELRHRKLLIYMKMTDTQNTNKLNLNLSSATHRAMCHTPTYYYVLTGYPFLPCNYLQAHHTQLHFKPLRTSPDL
jgi:hypothetical protein